MVLVVVDAAVVVMVAMSWYQCRDVLSVSVVIVVWLSVNVSNVFVAVLLVLVLVVKLLVMELLVKVIACVPKVVGVDGPLWVHVASLVVLA